MKQIYIQYVCVDVHAHMNLSLRVIYIPDKHLISLDKKLTVSLARIFQVPRLICSLWVCGMSAHHMDLPFVAIEIQV